MQYACHHAHFMAATPGFQSGTTSLLSSLGPLGMVGLLFAGVLATLFFLLWTTYQEQPAHADIGLLPYGERRRSEEAPSEDGPRISFVRYDQPPVMHQAPYDQPQAQYPEMTPDEPAPPGKYD